ncbi:MAG: hypothetical protein BWY62_01427 [Firmicutes bacterium ADurb.Bin356]|nr:MAG: hypothetical protein BWY62_01427 [Firmicutes bacterium ADurb.Bin356]
MPTLPKGTFAFASESTSATAAPSPPTMLCSSAVIIAPVSRAQLKSSSLSIGFIENISTTLTLTPSASRSFAASSELPTIYPQATTVASLPSLITFPLPSSKTVCASYKSTNALRESLIYIGEGSSSACFTSQSVEAASPATYTLKFGRLRIIAISSSAWWVGPSNASDMPP